VTRLLVLTIALVLAAAAPAAARIIPGVGIGGVTIGMTEAAVVDLLGDPDGRRIVDDDFGPSLRLRYDSEGGLRLILRENLVGVYEVFQVRTSGPVERTVEDVGVGTSERKLRRRLKGEHCETISGFRSCSIGSFTIGRVVTDFRIRRHHVTSVVVGRVVD
jgi:hypothetical protein